jgi:hypothetical protein
MFAWSYKELIAIPPHITQHRIDLDTTIPLACQAKYQMNLNYVAMVKQDLDKLLAVGFIAPMEEATWLSLIVVVSKKNDKSRICVDFHKLNVATKKDPYPLPFTKEVLDMVASHELYIFWMAFHATIRL